MNEDLKRALILGGGGLIAAVVLGGGWMFYTDGQRRQTLQADLGTWSTALEAYQGCLVGEDYVNTEQILLGMTLERTRAGRCYTEHLSGLTWSEDESTAALKSAVNALSRSEPASSRLSEMDADETCKQLAVVDAELSALRTAIEFPTGTPMVSDCALSLSTWPLVSQPLSTDPQIRKGALRKVEVRGDRLFAGYRMARQGVLAFGFTGEDWTIVPTEMALEGVFWGDKRPWGVVPDPEAPAGMIRYRVMSWSGTAWHLRSALPEGLIPYNASGPHGDYAVVSGPTWLVPVRNLREGELALLPMPDEGREAGEPVSLIPLQGDRKPTLSFSSDGTLIGMALADDPGGWAFLANLISGTETATSRIFLPVDVPDPLQSDTIATCGDTGYHFALAADRWVLRSVDGGRDWKLHHTFEQPLRRAVMACHNDSLAILADLDGARESVVLHYSVCDVDACREPEALGEQQASGRGIVFDDEGVRLLSNMLGYAVLFHDAEADGAPVPEHIYDSSEKADKTLPILSVDGRIYAIASGG